jgi:glycosyltransferase involved in cell wall biosynthesis
MPKVSVIVLTKNRSELLKKALASIEAQSFRDFEIVVVNDGSKDGTQEMLLAHQRISSSANQQMQIINHGESIGIIKSRQEALEKSSGELIAFLDDDDEWVDAEKLAKQVRYLDEHLKCVIVGGGIRIELGSKNHELRMRVETDQKIRNTMLFRNNFFTSTVMFRKDVAVKAGGFIKDDIDLAEDYDLWLRMGKLGDMYNFQEVFTKYTLPVYNKDKFRQFLRKQLRLIEPHKNDYPNYLLAALILRIRLLF